MTWKENRITPRFRKPSLHIFTFALVLHYYANLCHFLIQSEIKSKPTVKFLLTHVFPCLVPATCIWLIGSLDYLCPFWLANDYFGLGFMVRNWKLLYATDVASTNVLEFPPSKFLWGLQFEVLQCINHLLVWPWSGWVINFHRNFFFESRNCVQGVNKF